MGQEIARQLPNSELIVGQVAIEGGDHPIAVRPERTLVVDVHPMRIRVAGEVHPIPGHVLAVARGGEQAIHGPLVCVRTLVGEELIDLRRGGRQAGQVERDPPDEGLLRGLGRGLNCPGGQLGEHEAVDVVPRPGAPPAGGRLRPDRGLESPMFLIGRSRFNPTLEQRHLGGLELFARLGRGHGFLGIGGADPGPKLATSQVARLDCGPTVVEDRGSLGNVQSENRPCVCQHRNRGRAGRCRRGWGGCRG